MTLPLPASYTAGSEFTAAAENEVEAAINALGAGTLPIPKYVLASSATTLPLTAAHNMFVYTGSATATWTLPALSAVPFTFILMNRGTAPVTVQRAGSDLIYSGGSSLTSIDLPIGASLELVSDGTYWLVIGRNTPPPTYDGSAKSGYKNGINSGTAWTWTQNVNATSYGIVLLLQEAGGTEFNPTTSTKEVTFGGVTMNYLGFTGDWNNFGDHSAWVFGGPGVTPGASKTVSVKLTQASKKFYGHGISFTYSNVTAAGSLQADYSDDQELHQFSAIPMDSGPTVMWCAIGLSVVGDMPATTISNIRQTTNTASTPRCAAGDMSVFTTNPVKLMLYETQYAGAPIHGTHVALSLK